jgi:hypothetical protein
MMMVRTSRWGELSLATVFWRTGQSLIEIAIGNHCRTCSAPNEDDPCGPAGRQIAQRSSDRSGNHISPILNSLHALRGKKAWSMIALM